MSTYILRELERALGRARRRDVIERIGRKPEMTLDPPTAQLVREAREARTEELARRIGLGRHSDETDVD